MEEYMKLLLEQIRCKKAHPFIREEIQGHIEDQIEENIRQGMPKEEAEKAAVKDMGSPVEVGISLDRIHKPQAAWGMIGFMALISIAAIFFHKMIYSQLQDEPLVSELIQAQGMRSSDFTYYTIVGFIFMLVVYRMDYSVIARFAKLLAVGIIGMGVYGTYYGDMIGGARYSVTFCGVSISLFSIMMLYVPLYGAVIYQYHGKGYGALIKAFVWMLVPVFIAYRLPCLVLAVTLFVSMSVMLTVAIAHDWFKVAKKKVIVILWSFEVVLPVAGLILAYALGGLATYQMERIQAFLLNSGDANYTTSMLRENLRQSQWIGNRGKEWIGFLPEFNSDYIFSYMISSYGMLVGMMIMCVFAVLIIKIFSISFRQKNQLGMCMGCGCGMILLINVVVNIGENLGLIPMTASFLPFFSVGGNNLIVCYILMGVILSVYRHKNIYPAHINVKHPVARV